jgi:hypothetical protein
MTDQTPRASAKALEAAREALRKSTYATAHDIEVVALALDAFAVGKTSEERRRPERVFPDTEAGRALESYLASVREENRNRVGRMYVHLTEAMFVAGDRRAAEERERWAKWHELKALEAEQRAERRQYAEFHKECAAAIRALDDQSVP